MSKKRFGGVKVLKYSFVMKCLKEYNNCFTEKVDKQKN